MQEITFKGNLADIGGLKLKDKETGEDVEFIRIGGDLVDSVLLDRYYLHSRYNYILETIEKTKKGLETKPCFEPAISLNKLNDIAEALYSCITKLDEVLEGVLDYE